MCNSPPPPASYDDSLLGTHKGLRHCIEKFFDD
jgi:hypothetical protein